MLFKMRIIAVKLALVLLVSCAPYAKECTVPVLEDSPGLSVLTESKIYGECEELLKPKIPVDFLLEKDGALVYVASGERWYPRLYFDVVGAKGEKLYIESSHILESSNGPAVIRGREYRYFVRILDREENLWVSFRVCTATGFCGEELSIGYYLVRGYDLAIDSI